MIPLTYELNGVKISGYTAKPLKCRPKRNFQFFFVNGRYVKAYTCVSALEEAYQNSIMEGKFPACVLLITLPPTLVDINVHPTKLEAKFADEKAMYHAVYWAAKNALYQKQETPAVTLSVEEKLPLERTVTPAKAPVVMREAAVKRVEPSPFAWRGTNVNEQKKVHLNFSIDATSG